MRDALIDDVDRNFSQAMHVRFTRTIVATLQRVIEKSIHAIAVVLIILRGIDATLSRDRMRTARAIVKNETLNLVAELSESRRSGRAR